VGDRVRARLGSYGDDDPEEPASEVIVPSTSAPIIERTEETFFRDEADTKDSVR